MRIARRFLLLIFPLLVMGCSKLDIHGKIYIITESQQTIPLADTEIYILDGSKVVGLINEFEAERAEFKEKFQSVTSLIVQAAKIKEKEIFADLRLSLLDSKIGEYERGLSRRSPYLTNDIRDKIAYELEMATLLRQSLAKDVESLYNEHKAVQGLVDDLSAKRAFYNNPVSYINFLKSKTQGLSIRTDSEGRFIAYPQNPGKYFLLAHSQRKVPGKTEKYAWLLWVTLEKGKPTAMDLTNRNLYDTNCESCLRYEPIYAKLD